MPLEPQRLTATLNGTQRFGARLEDAVGVPGPPGPEGPQGPPGDPATQTPWAQDIDGAGFALSNTGDVGIGGSAIVDGDLSVLGTIAGSLMMIPPPEDGVFRVGEGWQLGPVADKLTLTADGSLIWQIASNLIGFDVPLSVNGQIEAKLGGVKFPDGTIQTTAATDGGGGAGAVDSVFGRTGAIVATSGDYNASQVTNAVSTLGSYADPAWITSLAWGKITGAPADAVSSVFGRTGSVVAQSGDYAAHYAPLVHAHAASDVTSGVFAVARLGAGTPSASAYLRGDGQWSTSSALQTPWTAHVDAAGFELRNAGKIGVGTSAPLAKLAVVGASDLNNAIFHVGTGTGAANDHVLKFGVVDGTHAWIQATQPGVAARNLVLQPIGGNIAMGGLESFGGGAGVFGITNCATVPTTSPANGGLLYIQAGALKYRGSSGTVTTIANA